MSPEAEAAWIAGIFTLLGVAANVFIAHRNQLAGKQLQKEGAKLQTELTILKDRLACVLTRRGLWGGVAERFVTGRGHRVILRTEEK